MIKRGIILLIVLFLVGCKAEITGNTIKCSSPYILSGESCCLDNNGNNVCDSQENTFVVEEEPEEQAQEEIVKAPEEPVLEEVKEEEEAETVEREVTTQPSTVGTPFYEPVREFEEYVNTGYGLKMKYPTKWAPINSDEKEVLVEFVSPLESTTDMFKESLNIVVQEVGPNMTLEMYKEMSLVQFNLLFNDVNIIYLDEGLFDGSPAHKVVYTADYGAYKLKFMQIYALKDEKAYLVTYAADEKKYNDFLPLALTSIGSFEFI